MTCTVTRWKEILTNLSKMVGSEEVTEPLTAKIQEAIAGMPDAAMVEIEVGDIEAEVIAESEP